MNPDAFSNQQEMDAFAGVDIFMSNVRVYDIGGAGKGLHGDIVQLQNGTYRNLFLENIEGTSGYQGFFIPQRLDGNPYLCSIYSMQKPDDSDQTRKVHRCFS